MTIALAAKVEQPPTGSGHEGIGTPAGHLTGFPHEVPLGSLPNRRSWPRRSGGSLSWTNAAADSGDRHHRGSLTGRLHWVACDQPSSLIGGSGHDHAFLCHNYSDLGFRVEVMGRTLEPLDCQSSALPAELRPRSCRESLLLLGAIPFK